MFEYTIDKISEHFKFTEKEKGEFEIEHNYNSHSLSHPKLNLKLIHVPNKRLSWILTDSTGWFMDELYKKESTAVERLIELENES